MGVEEKDMSKPHVLQLQMELQLDQPTTSLVVERLLQSATVT